MDFEINSLSISGSYEITCPLFLDHRGAFTNVFRLNELFLVQAWGNRTIAQVNFSFTEIPGTIRGLHLQQSPHTEAKIVRCLRGRVWDVIVDLRAESSTYGCWVGVELCCAKANAVLVPEGCAHGFQVLAPCSELIYLHSGHWVPEAETGIRFNDPQLGVEWPLPPTGLSERDMALPLLESFI